MQAINGLVDHLFRHRAGQMVATLTRIFGPEHLPLAEEVVQESLIAALTQWSFHGVPDNPAGWLFRVARNKALDQLRRQTTFQQKEPEIAAALSNVAIEENSGDDTLSMMLMCCHPTIPEESRIALTLKTVGGFSVEEIARAFLAKKETIAQRLVRAKKLIRDQSIAMEMPSRSELPQRLESLLKVIYLMFNEGHSAHEGDALVRADLCDEAIRLGSILAEHSATVSPAVHALLGLMLLQAARLPARVDACGDLAVLEEQDRSRWDRQFITRGMRHLEASASGDEITTYHVEAAIAACHAAAPSFEETDWRHIVSLYDELLEMNPSPVAALNRAVAIAMSQGPRAGIDAVESIAARDSLREYPLLYSTLGELWLRSGNRSRAAEEFSRALELPSSMPEKRFLLRKLESCR
ncbi:MAG: RNA polymerase subunit sigma-70 [Acidobacteria bacterium]|nr:MAG: RNA polymerase subunit sigma-70 [Acidobacteriota bacterium]